MPTVGEISLGDREPDNFEDHHAVCVRKDGRVVEHLERGVSGRFAQLIFFFLRDNRNARCTVTIISQPVNLRRHVGDESAM